MIFFFVQFRRHLQNLGMILSILVHESDSLVFFIPGDRTLWITLISTVLLLVVDCLLIGITGSPQEKDSSFISRLSQSYSVENSCIISKKTTNQQTSYFLVLSLILKNPILLEDSEDSYIIRNGMSIANLPLTVYKESLTTSADILTE